MNLASLTIKALHQRWVSKQLSAVDITEHYLSAISTANPELNAWTTLTASRARQQATSLDKQRDTGNPCGPLAAIP